MVDMFFFPNQYCLEGKSRHITIENIKKTRIAREFLLSLCAFFLLFKLYGMSCKKTRMLLFIDRMKKKRVDREEEEKNLSISIDIYIYISCVDIALLLIVYWQLQEKVSEGERERVNELKLFAIATDCRCRQRRKREFRFTIFFSLFNMCDAYTNSKCTIEKDTYAYIQLIRERRRKRRRR